MNTYTVTLDYKKSSRQAQYCEDIDAVTQAEAKMLATMRARNAGWKGSPIKAVAVIQRSEVA